MARVDEIEITKLRVSQILLFVAPLITLAVNPWSSYDPISLPKMLVLTCGAMSLLAIVIMNKSSFLESLDKPLVWISTLFLVFMCSAILFSGSPLEQQFWGAFGRNTGFLTYFSLLVVLLSLVWVRSKQFYLRLSWFFVLTSVPMTAYCLIQISGNDPFPWSEFNTFGTLGNINFLSAFLGMTSVGATVFAFDKSLKMLSRVLLLGLAIVDLLIIYSTGSIQGPVIYVVGLGVLILLYLLKLNKYRKVSLVAFSGATITAGTFLIMALGNSGPLARIIYQPSVIFRGDYIHAGWEMTMLRPIFGVGLDSYGDWYRSARGEISTLRTGPDRVANTAHNIFLDISSNGGVLLGLTYLALVFYVLVKSLSVLKTKFRNSSEFKIMFAVWIAYQVQALVSINQIGVGIWGWTLSGALIGYSYLAKASDSSQPEKKFRIKSKELRGKPMKASHALVGFFGFFLGFVLTAIPLNADIRYREASNRGDLNAMVAATNLMGSTEFHKELVLDFAMRNNLGTEVKNLATELVREHPRSFFGWRVLSVAALSTPEERFAALEKARELDPFNPDLR